MKRIVAFLIACFILISICNICVFAEDKTEQMLVLGDSISTGYGLENYSSSSPYKCASYANIIAKSLGLEGGSTYLNKAVNGDTSSDLLTLLPIVEEDMKKSDLIIVSIGGNDLLSTIPIIASAVSGKNITGFEEAVSLLSQVTPEQYATLLQTPDVAAKLNSVLSKFSSNIAQIVSKIKIVSPLARVVFLKQYNPMKNVPGFIALGDFASNMINVINSSLESACNSSGFEVIDVPSVIDVNPSSLTNILKYDIHPNAKGHAEIAKLLTDKLGILQNTSESSSTSSTLDQQETTEIPTVEKEQITTPQTNGTTKNDEGCSSIMSNITLFLIPLCAIACFKKKD